MRSRSIAAGLLALDLLALVALFNLFGWLRGVPMAHALIVTPLAMPALLLVFAIYLIDGYKIRTDMLSVDYASQHTIALISAMMVTMMVTFILYPGGLELQSSRAVIALSYLALIPTTLAYRRLVYLRALVRRGERCLVFFGDRSSGEAFAAECRRMAASQKIVFTVASAESAPPFGGSEREPAPVIHDVLQDIAHGRLATEAIVLRESARELPGAVSQRLVELTFAGVPTYTLERFHEVYWRKIPLYRLNQTWLFQEGFHVAREPVFDRLKRASDIALSLGGLLVFAPLIAAGALAVWAEDRGPAFFRQTRIGHKHVPFRVVKLRTMRPVAADAAPGRPAENRITRVGRFLRASRLDELPQLWNVLRGEMSLIGPRAEWDRLVEDYERAIPCYHFRHIVRPGITGWAQVNYPHGAGIEHTLRKLEYDLYYIRHFSFLLDAAIVLKTIHIMLFGKGR